jgi:hypothetical protein
MNETEIAISEEGKTHLGIRVYVCLVEERIVAPDEI